MKQMTSRKRAAESGDLLSVRSARARRARARRCVTVMCGNREPGSGPTTGLVLRCERRCCCRQPRASPVLHTRERTGRMACCRQKARSRQRTLCRFGGFDMFRLGRAAARRLWGRTLSSPRLGTLQRKSRRGRSSPEPSKCGRGGESDSSQRQLFWLSTSQGPLGRPSITNSFQPAASFRHLTTRPMYSKPAHG